jgi:hypothetical protein
MQDLTPGFPAARSTDLVPAKKSWDAACWG